MRTHAWIPIRNFKSTLPPDIGKIISVTTPNESEYFIHSKIIMVDGTYSHHMLIRWLQKLREIISPEEIHIVYTTKIIYNPRPRYIFPPISTEAS